MTTPRKIPFKPYRPKQALLLPPSLYEMVPANHHVRVVDRVGLIRSTSIHWLLLTKGAEVRVIVPDHDTINRFRGKQLEGQLKSIFTSGVILLDEEGHLSIKDVFVDGTKIEANANRYTFVWGKAIRMQVTKIKNQLESL
jgi:transposase